MKDLRGKANGRLHRRLPNTYNDNLTWNRRGRLLTPGPWSDSRQNPVNLEILYEDDMLPSFLRSSDIL
jgi:hypothetical protein